MCMYVRMLGSMYVYVYVCVCMCACKYVCLYCMYVM